MENDMKNMFRLFVVFAMMFAMQACVERVDVGNVGIKVNLAGDQRGAQDAPVVSGWVWYMPGSSTVIEFPASMQNVIWTHSPHEGSGADESISFTSQEGVNISADVGFAYHIDANRVGRIYTRFRADVGDGDLSRLSHGYIRNIVREALNEAASGMPVQDIYGPHKAELLHQAQRLISERLRPDFIVDQLTFTGALTLPPNVATAINNAMAATQQAIQAENAVRQRTAEAQQTIATAHGAAEAARQEAQGAADAQLIRARSDAETMRLRSEAEAAANARINNSLSPQVLQFRSLQRWNGVLPTFMGGNGATPFVQIPQHSAQ
jgi:regulator of protease activity HflC (stomatin/prohibitin superfamily)